MKYKKIMFLLFLFMEIILYAKELTLDEAIDIALQNNLTIKMSNYDVKNANLDFYKGLSGFLPTFDMRYSKMTQNLAKSMKMFAISMGPAATQFGLGEEINNFDMTLTVPIFTGGARALGTLISLNAKKLYKLQDQSQKNNIVFQTKMSFLQLIFLKKNIEIQNDAIRVAKEEYDIMVSKYDNGEIPSIVMNTQKINLQSEKNKLLEIQNQYDIALEKFKRFLKFTDNIDPTGTLSEDFPQLNEQKLIDRIATGKTIQILENQLKILKKSKWLNISSLLPSVIFSRGINYKTSDFSFDKDDWEFSARNMFIVDIPIFVNYNKLIDYKKSVNDMKKARLNLKNIKDQIITEVVGTLLDLKNNEATYQLLKENYMQAKDNYNATKQGFEKGEVGYTDLDKAKLLLNRTELGFYGTLLKKRSKKARFNY